MRKILPKFCSGVIFFLSFSDRQNREYIPLIIPANQNDLNVCELDKGKLLDVDQILAELAGLFYT